MKTISLEEFRAALKAQGVPREHLAFICPICRTVQSMADIRRTGAREETAEAAIGYSCIGRFTSAGPHKRSDQPGHGCDWTLGGLFRLHELEVVLPDGKRQPSFDVATPEEAQRHRAAAEAA